MTFILMRLPAQRLAAIVCGSALAFAANSLQAAPSTAHSTAFFSIRVSEYATYLKCDDPSTPKDKICAYPDVIWAPDTWIFELRPDRPSFLSQNIQIHHDKAGNVIAASVVTNGINGQKAAFDYLKMIYGPPKNYTVKTVHNRFNAAYQIIIARWSLSNGATVELAGAKDSLDEGLISYFP